MQSRGLITNLTLILILDPTFILILRFDNEDKNKDQEEVEHKHVE